jgi:hypothetical protein
MYLNFCVEKWGWRTLRSEIQEYKVCLFTALIAHKHKVGTLPVQLISCNICIRHNRNIIFGNMFDSGNWAISCLEIVCAFKRYAKKGVIVV